MKFKVGKYSRPGINIDELIQLESPPTQEQGRGLTYDDYLEVMGKWIEAKVEREIAKIRVELGLKGKPNDE